MSRILVTGGAGYIGSHTCKALAKAGHIPVTYDSLENGSRSAARWGPLEIGDIRDGHNLRAVLERHRPKAAIHFAAFIQVAESVSLPGKYYVNNVAGTINLLEAFRDAGLRSFVFSSSAAVYGLPKVLPVSEDHPLSPVNPYGRTKQMIETVVADYGDAYGLNWAALRYFNAAGADPDGQIGANHDPVTNLIPRVVRAGLGTGSTLQIFGTDYDTPDGTAIRDYIHVSDLASAHVAAVEHLMEGGISSPFNLGTGQGYSVHEVIETANRLLGTEIPTTECARRPGDLAVMVANPEKAKMLLDWSPQHSSLEEIIVSAATWERKRCVPHSQPATEGNQALSGASMLAS